MYKKVLVVLSLLFLVGCTKQSSTTLIIEDMNMSEYDKIKTELKTYMEQTLKIDCDDPEHEYLRKTPSGDNLICQNGFLVTNRNQDGSFPKQGDKFSITITYGDSPVYFISFSPRISEEHKEIQKDILSIASKYKKRYKNVQVIFRHTDYEKPIKLDIPN